jgi:hypothetical protein
MTREIRAALIRARTEKRSVVPATRLASGRQIILSDMQVPAALNDAAARALAVDKNATVEMKGENWFLQVHNLTLRLSLIGADHISQALM